MAMAMCSVTLWGAVQNWRVWEGRGYGISFLLTGGGSDCDQGRGSRGGESGNFMNALMGWRRMTGCE